jgi:anthranilate phosphoribosyltransferase
LIAGALALLGSTRALVVHGEPGMDEVSPLGITTVRRCETARYGMGRSIPRWAGYEGITATDLEGGEPADNAALIERRAAGDGSPAARAAVVLNAAAAIWSRTRPDFRPPWRWRATALEAGEALERMRGRALADLTTVGRRLPGQ